MTHLNIIQDNTRSENVDLYQDVVHSLYTLAKAGLDASSTLQGRIEVSYAVKKEVDWLTARYSNLFINVTQAYYMSFADPIFQQIVANRWGTNGNITEAQINAVTTTTQSDQYSLFKGNKQLRILDMRDFTISSAVNNKYGFQVYDYLEDTTPISERNYQLQEVYLNASSSIMINIAAMVYFYTSGIDYSPITNRTYGTITLPKFWCKGGTFVGENLNFHGLYITDCCANVPEIANDVFRICFITRLVLPSSTVVTGGSDVKGSSGGTNYIGSVYVPDDLVDSYKAASNWSDISSRIYPISDYDAVYGTWYKTN